MPIEVYTGIPGAGKTLRMLEEVEAKGRKEGRQVYYNGIKDLAIDGWIEFDDAEQWHTLPKGCIIVLDEAQRLFRPSHFAKEVPLYLSELETHRHNGYDIFMTTQRIMLLHTNLRGLIGRHVHVNRRFGTQRATLLEFPRAVEQPQAKQDDAIRHEWKYPENVFKWYKSAEVHTIKRQIPAKLYMLLVLPFIIGGLIYYGWSRQAARMKGDAAPVATGEPGRAAAGPINHNQKSGISTTDWLASHTPRLVGLAYTAPKYDEITKPVRVPAPSICVSTSARCSCYTDQATPLSVPETICRDIASHGFYNDFSPVASSGSAPGPIGRATQSPPDRAGTASASAPVSESKAFDGLAPSVEFPPSGSIRVL